MLGEGPAANFPQMSCRDKKKRHLLKRQLIGERFVAQKEKTSKEATITRIEVPGSHRIQ